MRLLLLGMTLLFVSACRSNQPETFWIIQNPEHPLDSSTPHDFEYKRDSSGNIAVKVVELDHDSMVKVIITMVDVTVANGATPPPFKTLSFCDVTPWISDTYRFKQKEFLNASAVEYQLEAIVPQAIAGDFVLYAGLGEMDISVLDARSVSHPWLVASPEHIREVAERNCRMARFEKLTGRSAHGFYYN